MDKTASLGTTWDLIYTEEDDIVYDKWCNSLTPERIRELETFVAQCVGNRGQATAMVDDIYEGSYNKVIRFSFSSGGNDVALKFPKQGHTVATLAAEKVANEAAWMEFLKEKTSIPVPRVYRCGAEPGDLLPVFEIPYILMDWVPGENLRQFLKKDAYEDLQSIIYEQIASILLEFYRLPVDGIGSVVRDKATGGWGVRRPLTMDMHCLASIVPCYPTQDWPDSEFRDVTNYFEFVAKQWQHQLQLHRNLNQPQRLKEQTKTDNPEDLARLRYEARYRITQLFEVDTFCPLDNKLGPFRTFNPDLDLRNMNIDPETGMVGIFDFEWTNGMPISFACDPPLFLYEYNASSTLDYGYFPMFLEGCGKTVTEFLAAMRRVEQKLCKEDPEQTPLSTLMWNSWTSKRVWFNYALSHYDGVDSIYWAVLHDLNPKASEELPSDVKEGMENYVLHTKHQLLEYNDALDQRAAAKVDSKMNESKLKESVM